MRLVSLSAAGYRSLRSIRLDIGQVSLFVGENGVGKSNLYRALQLIRAAADGSFAREVAREGGMESVLWSGRRPAGKPVRIALEAGFEDGAGRGFRYSIEAGLPPPASAGFLFEPHVKQEMVSLAAGRRTIELMHRNGPAVIARDADGRRAEEPLRLLNAETAFVALGSSGSHPEVASLMRATLGWRFYHGFRSDAGSPLRRPSLAVTAPMLDESGENLAAVFATLAHIRGDTTDLDRCVSDAFGGARLDIPVPGDTASFGLRPAEFPQRVFRPEELSDGQIRFLGLAGALLSYRLPELVALNEPETSLHDSMLPALAGMIARAAERTQVWVVTHSARLASLIADETGARVMVVVRENGATGIAGMRLGGGFADEADED